MDKHYDVIIVGTGAAGLFCALSLPDKYKVGILTKQNAEDSNSYLAQGGICVLRGESDYPGYFEDTMRAGHFENDGSAVELLIRSSGRIIRDLIRLGVEFDTDDAGNLSYTREGAHSRPRILYHKDMTGKEIIRALLKRAREKSNIEIAEHTAMIDIISENGVCGGVVALDESGRVFTLGADSVVLACGGIGGLFADSTNFPHITGDGVAAAVKHGVLLRNPDYIQIHPTTLYSKRPGRRFLISESVRGEGAVLLGKDGKRFTQELQPRDMLTRAVRNQMKKDKTEYVMEDMRPIGKETILRHFPNIYERCLEEGYNVLWEPIPVVPAQHYFMGGIAADLAGRTSMSGLYAVGETSCSGVHGRNRLASNSLLEALVFSQRAAEDIVFGPKRSGCVAESVDLGKYENPDEIFASYREVVLNEIEKAERERKMREETERSEAKRERVESASPGTKRKKRSEMPRPDIKREKRDEAVRTEASAS